MFSKIHSRALWIEEVTDDSVYSQDDRYLSMNTERIGCLNCNSENHETIDCTLPSHFVFKRGNVSYPRKMVLLKLCCNSVSNPRYMLPYDYPVKGTILHVNRKDNCLYVRPQNLDEICNVLDNSLFEARKTLLSPAAPNKIHIGNVYLIRRFGSNILARGVCAHMYFNWQMATQWQMYLIDNGQTEFVDQRSIYLLPSQLHSMPPLAVPLVLANCRLGYGGTVSCNMDHFPMLNVGSTCIFALSSSYQGRSLSLSENGYYPNFSLYPSPLLARIFGGTSLRNEIFCKWGLPEIAPPSRPICPLYYPSTFSFNDFTLQCPLPVTLTVRMTEKIDQIYYWLRDASFCSFISKQILLPSNGLWPYIEDNRSLACIAYVQRPLRRHPRYYRAVASNFDYYGSYCTVFLIDYGQTLSCYIHNLFDLSDQPPVVLYSFAAAFCCAVSRKVPTEDRIHAAKLAVDELYVIEVIGKVETSYVATVDMHIQPDFQYPRNFESNYALINDLQALMLNSNDKINRSNEVLNDNNDDSNDANKDNSNNVTADDNIDCHNNDNDSMDIDTKAMFPTVGMLMCSNREIGNIIKTLDVKISTKLAQISSRVDGLSNAVQSLQLANGNRNLLPFLQTYQYSDTQGMPNSGIQYQSSFPRSDANDMIFYDTNRQSSLLLGQTPFPSFQALTYPQHYMEQYHHYYHQQQQQSNFLVPSGRCYYPSSENHKCTFTNHQSQSDCQSHIYANYINQQVQRPTIDFTQKVYQKPLSLRSVIPRCTTCSQRINHENQALRSCCFCGAYMETKQRCFFTSNNTVIKHSTTSNLNATSFKTLTFASPKKLHGTSTASANTSFKHYNTPSNVDSQLSSRSNSPNNDFQLSIKNDTQHQLHPPLSSFPSSQPDRTPTPFVGAEREIMVINHKLSSAMIPSVQVRKDGLISYANVDNEPANNSSGVGLAPGKISYNMQDENAAASCWICGKVGHLTRYCQSTPPNVLFSTQEMIAGQKKRATDKPRNEKGMILYTSDESSDDELNYITANCDSEEDAKQIKNSANLDHDIKLVSDDDENGEFIQRLVLKYKAFFSHMNVEFGQLYIVSRSDEDIASSLWPLFFVQIQSTECQRILEMHLDSLVANIPLPDTEIVIGTLCVAYCERFDAKFRAVITAICGNLVEVFYIDYGNYEWVEQNALSSIADQDSTTITHPGMAIPCILNVYEEKPASCLSEDDVTKMKLSVSCSRWSFYLNFRKQRTDGVCVVEVE
ncbi:unnamed protein product [Litomosoides sigmodontis]|uniref:CCHC-type domain-containing protein n=1 Tax=Litomosoides sigmodontis TaxID=42156 RepID=A0A3P6TA16_LITSI|nr:unnamed protein product [Litomosoides sigmodontis]